MRVKFIIIKVKYTFGAAASKRKTAIKLLILYLYFNTIFIILQVL